MTPVLGLALSALLLQGPADSGPAEVRTVIVSVTDSKGAPVEGLAEEEVALLENGVARDLTRFEHETRPLMLAIVVDSSVGVGASFRLSLADAVASFLARLPAGTRYSLWTTGDRPEKIVDLTDDAQAAGKALRRVFPRGGNTLFDALVEASRDLKGQEQTRTAVVAVTGVGIGFTSYERRQVVEEVGRNAMTFMGVQFDEGREVPPTRRARDAGELAREDYDYVLGNLAERTGGLREAPLSSMGVASALQKIAADLKGRYRLSYATLRGIKDRKIGVQVARPGARARVVPSKP